jgi:hypothetical protein
VSTLNTIDVPTAINATATTATTTPTSTPAAGVPTMVAFDLYKDIHKAIRAELFAVTAEAGRLDANSPSARLGYGQRVRALVSLLVSHAEHEDGTIQAEIERLLPVYAPEIAGAHVALETQMEALLALVDLMIAAPAPAPARATATAAAARAAVHALYLDLAAFTATYLQHQDVEERFVMRMLDAALSVPELLVLHERILASVKPDVMVVCLQLMLPSMNIDDRTEMLAGMAAGAPVEVFAGVCGLAQSVLPPSDWQQLADRLVRSGVALDGAAFGVGA